MIIQNDPFQVNKKQQQFNILVRKNYLDRKKQKELIPSMKIMMTKWSFIFITITFLFLISCEGTQNKRSHGKEIKPYNEVSGSNKDTLYRTENLILVKLSNHVYQHISFLNTNDFGKVPCNGMVVVNDHQAIIFDTPADDTSSEELINYVFQNLDSKIRAVIPTHFHEDCVGGLKKFNNHQIPSFAFNKTIQLLTENGNEFAGIMKGFDDSLNLNLGDKMVEVKYFGEGHTKDNIIGYFPADSILFGGCLIKELSATKGNLEDANIDAWPTTVMKVKKQYPKARVVIPGHGKSGGRDLLDYTINLFR